MDFAVDALGEDRALMTAEDFAVYLGLGITIAGFVASFC